MWDRLTHNTLFAAVLFFGFFLGVFVILGAIQWLAGYDPSTYGLPAN